MPNVSIHDWLVAGGSSHEGCRLLLGTLNNGNLKSIFTRKSKHHDQIVRNALAYHIGFKQPEKITFRNEFPFLREPDCPFELKILAANKITAYHNYKGAHQALFTCNSINEQFLTVKLLVENFIDNQLIFRELDYYKAKSKLLGQHPVFKELNRIKEIRKSSPVELVEQRTKIQHNIWRIESEIAKGDKPHLQVERENKLQLRKNELAEIERLIESYR